MKPGVFGSEASSATGCFNVLFLFDEDTGCRSIAILLRGTVGDRGCMRAWALATSSAMRDFSVMRISSFDLPARRWKSIILEL